MMPPPLFEVFCYRFERLLVKLRVRRGSRRRWRRIPLTNAY